MTKPANVFNALTDPWVPVIDHEQNKNTVSLNELATEGSRYASLGHELVPAEKDALYRFLTSHYATVMTAGLPENQDDRSMKTVRPLLVNNNLDHELVAEFTRKNHDRYLLSGPTAFLQEPRIEPEKNNPAVLPLKQLHIHVPGGRTTTFGRRPEHRDPEDPAVLTLLLVLAWFNSFASSTRWDTELYSGKQVSGSPSGVMRGTALWLTGDNLNETIWANVPQKWVIEDLTLPAWLTQETPYDDIAWLKQNPWSMWQTTWTPNRPKIIYNENGHPAGWVCGLTNTPTPPINSTDPKVNAKKMHHLDYARAWRTPTSDDPVETKATSDNTPYAVTFPVNMNSMKGMLYWHNHDLQKILKDWGTERVVPKSRISHLSMFNSRADKHGIRQVEEWETLPLKMVSPDPSTALRLHTILGYVSTCRTILRAATAQTMRTFVTEQAGQWATETEELFYKNVDRTLFGFLVESAEVDTTEMCRVIENITTETFDTVTAPFSSPSRISEIQKNRTVLAGRVADMNPTSERNGHAQMQTPGLTGLRSSGK